MPRSMWRGAIQFGLVTVPVKLYLATEARGGLSFNLLHKECLNRIQMKVHCPVHGEIPRSDTVRGFEYSKGQYVIIEEGDFDNVPLKTVRSIEIELFIDAQRDSQVAHFVKQAYYLEPEPIGRKAFYLLKSVLQDEGLSAIAKIVLKDREALAAIDPYAKTMLLSTLYWPDEIRAVDELDLPEDEFDFKPAEKTMAAQLVEAMRGEFVAENYRDEYREALASVIEAKIAGKPAAELPNAAETPTKIADLMSVLEASVAAARESRTGRGATKEEAAASSGKGKVASIKSGSKRAAAKKAATAAATTQKPERRRKTA